MLSIVATVNVYVLPFVSPVAVHDVAVLVVAAGHASIEEVFVVASCALTVYPMMAPPGATAPLQLTVADRLPLTA
jgi:hypothetical protein